MIFGTILAWIVIGIVAGFLANAITKGGYGLGGDMVIGTIGALIGGSLFHRMEWHPPLSAIVGTLVTAFVGAVVLLVGLRIVRSAGPTRA